MNEPRPKLVFTGHAMVGFSRQSSVLFEVLEPRAMFSAAPLHPVAEAAFRSVGTMTAAYHKLYSAPSSAGTGLTGEYFSDNGFSQPLMIRNDPTLNLHSGRDSALKQSNSMQWTGTVVPTYSQSYVFTVVSNGGVKLAINGVTVIDQLQSAGSTFRGTPIMLTAGQHDSIVLQYLKHGAPTASIKLFWSSTSQKQQVVPQGALFPAAVQPTLPAQSAALIGQYYSGENFDQLVMTRADPEINFNFGASSPTPLIPNHTPFSIRWTGMIKATSTGAYTFSTTSDDGARLYIGGQLVIDNYHVEAATTKTGEINLTAGQTYDIEVDYFQNGIGVGSMKLQWTGPDVPTQVVPAGMFSSTPPATAGVLTAAATSASEIDLAWTGSPTATGYEIDQQIDDVWTSVGTTPAGTTTFADTGLTPGAAYSLRVEPLGSPVTSIVSNVVQVSTMTDAPGAPTVTAASAAEVDLGWNDVAGEDGFTVLDSTNGGQTFSPAGVIAQGMTAFDAIGLTPGTDYQFAVESLNSDLVASAPSTPVDQSTTPLAPAVVTAVATSVSSVNVTWTDVPSEAGFTVERSTTGTDGWATVATLPAGTLSHTDTGLTAGTVYFYRVRALDAGGASAPSIDATALTVPGVPAPSLAGLNVSSSSVSFPAVAGATSYAVQRSLDGSTGWTTVSTVTPSTAPASMFAGPADSTVGATLSATVANIAPSTVYYYRVIASNATGSSAPSPVVSQMSAPLAAYAEANVLYGVANAVTGGANLDPAVYALNMTAGTSTLIGQLMPGAYAADRDPVDGYIWYNAAPTSNIAAAYYWDPTTGNNVFVGDFPYNAPQNRGTFDAAGGGYASDTADNLYSVPSPASTNTGLALVGKLKVAGVALPAGNGNMAMSPQGTLYLTNDGTIYTVNTTTAALTPVLQLGTNDVCIVFGNNGLLYATDSNGHEYSVNVNTLTSTLLANPAMPVFNSLTALPEFDDLSVMATATPTTFAPGGAAAYSINVSNAGPSSADGISVSVTLGLGVTYTSLAGTNWTAVAGAVGTTGQTVVLTYTGSLTANANAPTITLNVAVGTSAYPTAVATMNVSGNEFDTGLTNNVAVVTTPVL